MTVGPALTVAMVTVLFAAVAIEEICEADGEDVRDWLLTFVLLGVATVCWAALTRPSWPVWCSAFG